MKKNRSSKLRLNRETLRNLQSDHAGHVAGGFSAECNSTASDCPADTCINCPNHTDAGGTDTCPNTDGCIWTPPTSVNFIPRRDC